jgi:chemotaxis protein MotB
MSEVTERPIIVIKKKGGHGGHHGGAWKVAYADFVTAMMSLFIVLWLLNSTPQVKKAIAGYFNDPLGTSKNMGTDILGSGESVTIDQTNVEKLQEQIRKAIIKQKELDKLANQVELKMTDEGLRIELIDGKSGSFFESGSPKLTPDGLKLLDSIADQLKPLPNHLLIEGHTDAKAFGDVTNGYSNWELSADRANSARRIMQAEGVRDDQIAQVRGYAAQSLRTPSDPLAPSNRRISIVVQFLQAPAGTKGPEILNPTDDAKDSKKEGGKGEAEGKSKGEGASSGASAGGNKSVEMPESKPAEAQPSAGKIDLPPVPAGAAKPAAPQSPAPKSSGGKPSAASPSGKTSENLGNQLNQMRDMKQADAKGHTS